MPKGWSNPKNAQPDTGGGGGGFKEGLVRVDKSTFTVWQPKGAADKAAPLPVSGMVWEVTRLDEAMEPMVNEGTDGEHLTERLQFSFGTKALAKIHPGKGDGPDDEEPEDCGSEIGVEGNTAFFVEPTFQLHPKCSYLVVTGSIIKADSKLESIVDRGWAPDYTGCIFFMGTWIDNELKNTYVDKKTNETVTKGTAFKVVTKVVRGPGEKKAGATGKSQGGLTNGVAASHGGGNPVAEKIAEQMLKKVSEGNDGTQCSLKMLSRKLSGALQAEKVDPKLHVPVLGFVKPNAAGEYSWLVTNGGKFDMSFDWAAEVVTFGVVGGAE